MSTQTNRGGMGSHKHGVSGHTHRSSRNKQAQQRETNAELDRRAFYRRIRRDDTYDTVSELFRRHRRKRNR